MSDDPEDTGLSIVFVGSGLPGDNDICEVFGQTFVKGEEATDEVIDALTDSQIMTLSTNPTFKVGGKLVKPADEAAADLGPVEIPADWEQLPFMAMRQLARRIDPTLANTATKTVISKVIADAVAAKTA